MMESVQRASQIIVLSGFNQTQQSYWEKGFSILDEDLLQQFSSNPIQDSQATGQDKELNLQLDMKKAC